MRRISRGVLVGWLLLASWLGWAQPCAAQDNEVIYAAAVRNKEVFDVKAFGARGNGSTDDYTAIMAAYNAMPTEHHGTLFFPPGVYAFGTPLVLTGTDLTIKGDNATLYFTGTGIALTVDGSIPSAYRYGTGIENLHIRGNANATVGLYIRKSHHGRYVNIRVEDVTTTGILLGDTVVNYFENLRVSANETVQSPQPVTGLKLGNGSSAEGSWANTFINTIMEGVSGYGISVEYGAQNVFVGGTSEGNGGGVYVGVTNRNSFTGIDCEANTTYDWRLSGPVGTTLNAVLGASTGSAVGLRIDTSSYQTNVRGSSFHKVDIASAVGTTLENVTWSISGSGGSFADTGTNTHLRHVLDAYTPAWTANKQNATTFTGTATLNNAIGLVWNHPTSGTVGWTLDGSNYLTTAGGTVYPSRINLFTAAGTGAYVGNTGNLIVSGANLGAGTTAPDKRLEVNGEIRVTYNDSDGGAANYMDMSVASTGNATLKPTGDLLLDPTGNDVLPATVYDINLGSDFVRFNSIYANELNVGTLVSRQVISTIGGRILTTVSSTLTADRTAGASSMQVKHNAFVYGEFLAMESRGNFEVMQVTRIAINGGNQGAKQFTVSGDLTAYFPSTMAFYLANSTGNNGTYTVASSSYSSPNTTITVNESIPSATMDGGVLYQSHSSFTGYKYFTSRNLDGTGANAWYTGDAVVSLGSTTSSGFIDQYSASSIRPGGTEIGPTMVGNVRTSTGDWTAWSPRWAIGNLNGLFGYATNEYGAAFGNPAASWVKIDATNGVRMGNGATTKISINPAGAASFSGEITAAGGTIGGWAIGPTYLTDTASLVGMSSLVTGADDVRFFAGNVTPTSAPFRVTEAGVATMTSGNIGGWTLGATALTSGSGGTTVGLDSGGTNPAIYAGSATPASAPFRVTGAGALYASNATISGSITATSGTFGGWTLSANALTAGSGSTTVGLDSGGTNPAFYAGSATPASAPFRVTNAGALTATNATITGTVNATSGYFGDAATDVVVDSQGISMGTTGRLSAGGGAVTINNSGINIQAGTGAGNGILWDDGSYFRSNADNLVHYSQGTQYFESYGVVYWLNGSDFYPNATGHLGKSTAKWDHAYINTPHVYTELKIETANNSTASDYPLIWSSGSKSVYMKTDGIDNTDVCTGYDFVATMAIEKGIVTGVTCGNLPAPFKVSAQALFQQNQIDTLKAQVASLEERLTRLEALLSVRQ